MMRSDFSNCRKSFYSSEGEILSGSVALTFQVAIDTVKGSLCLSLKMGS